MYSLADRLRGGLLRAAASLRDPPSSPYTARDFPTFAELERSR